MQRSASAEWLAACPAKLLIFHNPVHAPHDPRRRRCSARCGARDRLESANPAMSALSSHDGEGKVEASSGHGDRTRTGRVRLVHCLHHHGSTYKELSRNDAIRKDLPNWVNNPLQRVASSTNKGDS